MHAHCNEYARLAQGSGWDPSRIARELGLHPTVLWKYRRCVAVPSITVLRLLAVLTGQQIALTGEPRLTANSPRWVEDWEEEILAVLRRLEPGRRRRAILAIRDLVEISVRGAEPSPTPGRPRDPLPSVQAIIADAAAGLGHGAPCSGPPAAISVQGATIAMGEGAKKREPQRGKGLRKGATSRGE